ALDSDQPELRSQRITAGFAPEAPCPAIVDVEYEEPIRQPVVIDRVTRCTPFSEQDQMALQVRGQRLAVPSKPTVQPAELTGIRLTQILASVLRAQLSARRERNTDVRAVHLLFRDDPVLQQRFSILGRQNLVVARHVFAQPCQM